MSCSARWRTLAAAASICLTPACSHYQAGGSDYRGPGDFRTPSEYSTPFTGESAARAATEFKLSWPVTRVRVNRGFKPGRRPHQGVDLGGGNGTPILAAHEGVVVYAGRDFRGFGNMVLIEYDSEWASLYGHLSQIDVKEGKVVQAGDQIGRMGKTGRATGVHLHFELIRNRQPVDPLPYLTRFEKLAGTE